MATFRNTFSDYRRWVSPALSNATLESQLEQWWPKGQYFSQAVVNFQTSVAQLLPNLADNFNWTSMETLIWNSSPMALPFANCNFGIQTVADELSNFMIWLTVPSSEGVLSKNVHGHPFRSTLEAASRGLCFYKWSLELPLFNKVGTTFLCVSIIDQPSTEKSRRLQSNQVANHLWMATAESLFRQLWHYLE